MERTVDPVDDLSNIVDILISEIQNKVNSAPAIFNLWFGGLRLVSLTEKKATFVTPTLLRKNILTMSYKETIEQTLEEILSYHAEVEILTEAENKSEPKPSPAPSEIEDDIDEDILKEGKEEEKKVAEYINTPSDTAERKSTLEEYTFDNFVEGSSNKLARAACYAVAEEPNTYNPLFIYGHSGLGKTHLLFAVINYMRKNHPELKIVYKKCETFLDELIKAIKQGSTAPFKEKYRSADVLLIDDVQFLAGKEQTQEEFFHTFSALYESDKQIILTSDRPPKDIKPLEDRLRSRFEGGLIADVQPPSFELRIAIIKKKADAMGLSISNELIEYMAERLRNNIRQIEGVLKKIYAIYSLTSAEVTKDKIDDVISIIDPGNIPIDTLIERILGAVSRAYGVSVEDMKSKKRTDSIASARHVAIYVIKHLTDLTLKEIGAVFDRDYSTVISSIDKVEKNISTVNNYENDINKIIKEVKGEA